MNLLLILPVIAAHSLVDADTRFHFCGTTAGCIGCLGDQCVSAQDVIDEEMDRKQLKRASLARLSSVSEQAIVVAAGQVLRWSQQEKSFRRLSISEFQNRVDWLTSGGRRLALKSKKFHQNEKLHSGQMVRHFAMHKQPKDKILFKRHTKRRVTWSGRVVSGDVHSRLQLNDRQQSISVSGNYISEDDRDLLEQTIQRTTVATLLLRNEQSEENSTQLQEPVAGTQQMLISV